MMNNKPKIMILASLITAFGITTVNANEYKLQRSGQMEMMERHQDQRKELRETHRADLKDIRELHTKELDLLLKQQENERSAERSRRLRR
ncbi:MAG: hypothetical protein HKP55_01770 [Gammaproteobacteria bacterium]|nr:hypothetical protein [Gammaproteobacteria bacterium]